MYRLIHPTLLLEVAALPSAADTSELYPRVWDQGNSSSCVGHSVAATACHERARLRLSPSLELSRLFLYYGARAIGGNVDTDDGAEIRDGFKTLAQSGAPREDVWPFYSNLRNIVQQPSHQAYLAATWHKATKYRPSPQNLDVLKAIVASGQAFSFGFSVYEEFESETVAHSGILTLPGTTESQVGGHAVSCAGYDDSVKAFKVRNSWGPDWGQHGYFWMPYDYILNPDLASDFWIADQMSA